MQSLFCILFFQDVDGGLLPVLHQHVHLSRGQHQLLLPTENLGRDGDPRGVAGTCEGRGMHQQQGLLPQQPTGKTMVISLTQQPSGKTMVISLTQQPSGKTMVISLTQQPSGKTMVISRYSTHRSNMDLSLTCSSSRW